MKKSFLILGLAAAALAVSCNKDDLTGNVVKVFEGDKAYVIVNINGVSASETRAEGEFLAGDEHDVRDACFYFYDSDGIFVTEGEAWNTTSGTTSTGIEYAANSVVVLTGLTQVKYPNWVVTLINRPDGFKAPATLEEFATVLGDADGALWQTSGGTTYYSMTTSSYDGSTQTPSNVYTSADGGKYYFATPVQETNFIEEPVTYQKDSDGNDTATPDIPEGKSAVTIYVERLAAKVTVALSADGLGLITSGGISYCSLTQNVYESGTQPVSENMYIRLDGWKLNATARQTAYVKDIDATWTDEALGFTWNDPDNRRSYWGRCWFYGLGAEDGSYPDDGSDGNTDDDEAGAKARSPYVKYTSLNDLNTFSTVSTSVVTFAGAEYCAENSNTAEIEDIRTAVTSILIRATACLYDSEEGTYDPVSLIRHNGQIYTLDAYLDLAVSHIPSGYYYEGDDGEYVPLDRTCLTVDVENSLNGYVEVVAGSSEIYQYDDDSGSYDEADITSLLETFNAAYGTDANYFNGGAMYYSIPIRHLSDNTTEVTDDETGQTSEVPDEGYYGVVRNHWYLGTLNSLSKLGKGIANTDEVIVPLPEDETSYLPAEVNIIPWRYVYWDLDL